MEYNFLVYNIDVKESGGLFAIDNIAGLITPLTLINCCLESDAS